MNNMLETAAGQHPLLAILLGAAAVAGIVYGAHLHGGEQWAVPVATGFGGFIIGWFLGHYFAETH